MCRDTYREYRASLPDHIQKLNWMVRAVVHIQEILNARNVRYEPYDLLDHFPSTIYGQPKATRWRTDSDSSSLSSSSLSSSSLTSDNQDEDEDRSKEVVGRPVELHEVVERNLKRTKQMPCGTGHPI